MKLRPSKKSRESKSGPLSAISSGRFELESLLADDPNRHEILNRYDRYAQDLYNGLGAVYQADEVFPEIINTIASIHKSRSPRLRHRDQVRTLQPDWFQQNSAIGYVAYTDLFAGDLKGVRGKINYLTELGVTYLHLMPLLTPRPGANDGGYAVMDLSLIHI